MRRLISVASALALATGVFLGVPGTAGAATFDVRDYGATGNGSSNDTPAIQRAIDAASAAGGGTVQFPSGTYQSRNTIHMRSDITMLLDAGATIRGASNDDYDAAEDNPNDDFQDFGHSHFHNAMIFGDRLSNIAFVGDGVIDGGGNLITGNPGDGEADKIISLTRCDGLNVGDGLTLRRGGHFAMLINGCTGVTSDRLRIDTASDRDGWNVISTTDVRITNANIAANDDALAFKSDYALGAKLPNGNVVVSDSHLSARCCNALMFGSETCGDFTGYDFGRITIDGSDKSGLGMVSMDGAVISDVHYKDITMTNVRAAITQKIGTRRRCGNNPGVGRIHDVTYENITSSGQSGNNFTATLWGESGANRISDVTFTNVNLTVPGGNGSVSTGVPSNDPNNYNPNSIGTRPAYGWYLRNVNNVRFVGGSVRFAASDARPAVIANTSTGVAFDPFVAQRGTASADVVFQSVNGYCARGTNTTGGALRVSQTGSTESCGGGSGRFEAENGQCDGTIDSNHAGFSGTGFCNTTNAVGSAEEWTVPQTLPASHGMTSDVRRQTSDLDEAAGAATMVFRFANGTTVARPMDLVVNGTSVGTLTFGGTGAWTTWQTLSAQVPLNAGANTVRLVATTANGGPNVDCLEVV